MSSQDPSQLRISDDDRHQVAEILRQAAGDGRIDLGELDERLEQTYAAKTYADLVPITFDLPVTPGQPGLPVAIPAVAGVPTAYTNQGSASESHVAILSGLDRKGVWTVPASMTINCLMGGANLDLRRAVFSSREVVITVNAFMGGASIVVGPTTNVVMEGIGIMGGYAGPPDLVASEQAPDSPTVRVRGIAVWGGVSVERKALKPPRRLRRR
ncbi:DUF1707 domain-containing protein [Nocardioides panacihumi]|uniref:DUF1707 domain-containing protein n=1 Tax=Nocardioides panacihumi TaxID=400774 RepID=A0ABN2RLC6_9ACTN